MRPALRCSHPLLSHDIPGTHLHRPSRAEGWKTHHDFMDKLVSILIAWAVSSFIAKSVEHKEAGSYKEYWRYNFSLTIKIVFWESVKTCVVLYIKMKLGKSRTDRYQVHTQRLHQGEELCQKTFRNPRRDLIMFIKIKEKNPILRAKF